jgi:signal peptide peptidase sppA, 67K type
VDELGGLERAIELAGEQAKIINYNVIEVTSKSDFLRDLLEKQVGRIKMSILKDALGEDYEYVKALRTAHPTYGVQARMLYTPNNL